jgi:hypothetical protein
VPNAELVADAEFDRQVRALCEAGYARLEGSEGAALTARLDALRPLLAAVPASTSHLTATPFVVVPAPGRVPPDETVPLLRLTGSERHGQLDPNHGEEGLAPYRPLPELDVPNGQDYLLLDVQRGDEYRGMAPRDAVEEIRARSRSPLTIAEGIAWVLTRPDALQQNHCFMLAGSRRGDRRVPALWISKRAPKLGWCWEGNPHSWLGTASATRRETVAGVHLRRTG